MGQGRERRTDKKKMRLAERWSVLQTDSPLIPAKLLWWPAGSKHLSPLPMLSFHLKRVRSVQETLEPEVCVVDLLLPWKMVSRYVKYVQSMVNGSKRVSVGQETEHVPFFFFRYI